MSMRIGGSSGIGGSAPITGADAVDQLSDSAASKAKKLKKGLGDTKDSFENANQQVSGQQPPGTHPVSSQDHHDSAKVGSAGTETSGVTGGDIPYRRKRHMDENGYVWTSIDFEPPTVKDSQAMDDPFPNQDALDKLGKLWADFAERMGSQPIRS